MQQLEKGKRDAVVNFRTTEETKAKAAKKLMNVSSKSEVFRRLLNAKAAELGIN